jgi:KRAB domain-containing zinc finger protein
MKGNHHYRNDIPQGPGMLGSGGGMNEQHRNIMNWQQNPSGGGPNPPPHHSDMKMHGEDRQRYDPQGGAEVFCPHCNLRTPNRGYLAQHMRDAHNNTKKEACPHCPFTASMKHHVRQHIKSEHSNIKDFYCQKCDYSAALKTSLRHHYKTNHADVNIHALMGED